MQVVIPAYQPGAVLPELVRGLFTAHPSIEVLVVDDGSDPARRHLFDECQSSGAQVLRLPANRGKGHALRAGFTHLRETCSNTAVVTADADGQHAVADILAVGNAVDTRPVAAPHLVLGERRLDSDAPMRSRVGNNVTRLMFRAVTGRSLHDTQTGLRAFPGSLLPWLVELRGERYEYELVMLLHAVRHRVELRRVPIQTIYLDGNASSHFRPVADSIHVCAPLLTFVGTSLSAFLIDTVAVLGLHALLGALLPAVIVARVVSGTANFVLNRHLVFPGVGRSQPRFTAASRYVALAGVLLSANYLLLATLYSTGLPLLLAKVLTELVLVVASYVAQARYVFACSTPALADSGRASEQRVSDGGHTRPSA